MPRTGAFRRSRHSWGGGILYFALLCFTLHYITLLYLFLVHPPLLGSGAVVCPMHPYPTQGPLLHMPTQAHLAPGPWPVSVCLHQCWCCRAISYANTNHLRHVHLAGGVSGGPKASCGMWVLLELRWPFWQILEPTFFDDMEGPTCHGSIYSMCRT